MENRVQKTRRLYGNFCHVPGCNKPRRPASGNKWCNKHDHQLKTHGDIKQTPLPGHVLKDFTAKVSQVLTIASKDPQWIPRVIDPLRRNIEDSAKENAFQVKLYLDGKAMARGDRFAYFMLNGFHSLLTLEEKLKFWCAFQYMYQQDSGLFASDRGYRFQLVRWVYKKSGVRLTKPKATNRKVGAEAYRYSTQSLKLSRYTVDRVYDELFSVFGSIGYHLYRRWDPEKLKRDYKESILDFFSKEPELPIAHKKRILNQIAKTLQGSTNETSKTNSSTPEISGSS